MGVAHPIMLLQLATLVPIIYGFSHREKKAYKVLTVCGMLGWMFVGFIAFDYVIKSV
jgi:hypothetical protein